VSANGHAVTHLLLTPGGVALGALSRAFELHDPSVGGRTWAPCLGSGDPAKTARRLFAGDRVDVDSVNDVCEQVAGALLHSALLPDTQAAQVVGSFGVQRSPNQALGFIIRFNLELWNYCAGATAGAAPRVPLVPAALMPYFRLVTIDWALRYAAVLILEKRCVPVEPRPLWAEVDGRSRFFRRLLDDCGDQKPTRQAIAEHLGTSPSTVGRWLDNNQRPLDANLEGLADLLAARSPGLPKASLLRALRRHYGLHEVATVVANLIGWDRPVHNVPGDGAAECGGEVGGTDVPQLVDLGLGVEGESAAGVV
jgi:hypothetical protein